MFDACLVPVCSQAPGGSSSGGKGVPKPIRAFVLANVLLLNCLLMDQATTDFVRGLLRRYPELGVAQLNGAQIGRFEARFAGAEARGGNAGDDDGGVAGSILLESDSSESDDDGDDGVDGDAPGVGPGGANATHWVGHLNPNPLGGGSLAHAHDNDLDKDSDSDGNDDVEGASAPKRRRADVNHGPPQAQAVRKRHSATHPRAAPLAAPAAAAAAGGAPAAPKGVAGVPRAAAKAAGRPATGAAASSTSASAGAGGAAAAAAGGEDGDEDEAPVDDRSHWGPAEVGGVLGMARRVAEDNALPDSYKVLRQTDRRLEALRPWTHNNLGEMVGALEALVDEADSNAMFNFLLMNYVYGLVDQRIPQAVNRDRILFNLFPNRNINTIRHNLPLGRLLVDHNIMFAILLPSGNRRFAVRQAREIFNGMQRFGLPVIGRLHQLVRTIRVQHADGNHEHLVTILNRIRDVVDTALDEQLGAPAPTGGEAPQPRLPGPPPPPKGGLGGGFGTGSAAA